MFNKALFKKEWKTFKWISLFFLIGLFFIKVYNVYINLNNYISHQKQFDFPIEAHELIGIFNVYVFFQRPYEVIFCVLVIIFIAIALFYDSRNTHYSLLASMPFKRKEIIFTKLMTGLLTIIAVISINFLFLTGIYFAYIHKACIVSYDNDLTMFYQLVQWFIINICVYVTVFSLSMMIQSLLGNQILAGVISGIILVYPLGLLGMLDMLIRRFKFLPQDQDLYIVGYKLTFTTYIYDDWMTYPMQIIITFLLTLIFTTICYHAYIHNHLEKNGNFVMFEPLETVFVVGFSISFGLLISVMGINSYQNNYMLLTVIYLVIGAIIGFFIAKLLLKLTLKKST